MLGGKRAAGAALEIALEGDRDALVSELVIGKEAPGLELRRVWRLAGNVGVQPGGNVVAKAGVELTGMVDALEDVDVVHQPETKVG